MKTRVLVALLCSFFPLSVWAQADTAYLRLGIGPAFSQPADLEEFATEPIAGAELKFDTGFQLNLSGGYRFTDWLAVELQGGFIYNSVRTIGLPSSGDLTVAQYPLLANVVLELPTSSRLVPYIGAGMGGSLSLLDADHFSVGGTTADGTFSDFVFAYQAFAGLRYEINPSMAVVVGYRFFHADPTRWEPDVTFGTSGDIRADRIQTHAVTVGFTFSF